MPSHTINYYDRPREKQPQLVATIEKKIKQTEFVQISLDEATAWVQPNVTMLALVQATMKERLIPSVVASSRDTTVLEAFVTETGSSSSFRYGTFDCAVLSLKCVRRDGQEIMVKLHDGDAVEKLLEDVLITLLEIALIPAGKYVEITYWPVDSLSTAYLRIMPKGHESWVNHISALYDSTDFMDSVMFDQSSGIVVVGKITSEVGCAHSRFEGSDTFMQHAESIGTELRGTLNTKVETAPLIDYLFRYDVRPAAQSKRRSGGRSDIFVTQDSAEAVQDVILPTQYLTLDVLGSHWWRSTLFISMAGVEPHSTFGRRRAGTRATLDDVRWHIRAVRYERKKKSNLAARRTIQPYECYEIHQ